MNLSRLSGDEAAKRETKPVPVAVEFVKESWKPPSLMRTSQIASEILTWKRISRPKEHVYLGSTGDGTSIAVTVLTTVPPKYVTYISHSSQPGFRTFTTAVDHREAEIPERIINTAVISILRDRSGEA